jgi:hypothetical protein
MRQNTFISEIEHLYQNTEHNTQYKYSTVQYQYILKTTLLREQYYQNTFTKTVKPEHFLPQYFL